MTFTIHIAAWLGYVVGVPVLVAVLFLAWVGYQFLKAFSALSR